MIHQFAKYKVSIVLSFFLGALSCFGQAVGVEVKSENRSDYLFPWAGGMNSCQFGTLDLNLDGVKDLVVFDRVGDRLMPFLATLSGDSYTYIYAPEYEQDFPVLSQWVNFTDYNRDGKEDIFTYAGYGTMTVYRNISSSNLAFEPAVYPYLTSFQGGGYVNLYVTYADYPAIYDLDNDGDLDILTFWGLGSFVEKHRNMSVEKYGNADSLDYIKTDFCWGYFAESEESNQISLDTCLKCCEEAGGHGGMEAWKLELRHTGSTFCILDLDGNTTPDLLLGDVDYPNLVALYNGGIPDTAKIISFDWQFPPGQQNVDMFSMPAAFYNDFDFDGVADLMVAPFDPNPYNTENYESNWFYHNNGTDNLPLFDLRSRSFIQDQMIDLGAGAFPVFLDVDNDGLTDLLAGNFGYYDSSYYDNYMFLHTIQTGKIAYFSNTGMLAQPKFTFITRDFAEISKIQTRGVYPTFGDLDGDGDEDMLAGNEAGQIIYFQNTANPGEFMVLEPENLAYENIDVGSFSTPQLFDLDRDNRPDLIIGEKGGNLNYYRNSGTAENPDFNLVTDSLGKINVTDYSVSLDGYSVPCFYRVDGGPTHLLVGAETGKVHYFTGIDGNLNGKFKASDTLAGLIGVEEIKSDYGFRSAPALADLDGDGYPEMIVGNFSGGFNFIGRNSSSPVNEVKYPAAGQNFRVTITPNPSKGHFTVNCVDNEQKADLQLILFDGAGRMVLSAKGKSGEKIFVDTKSYKPGLYFLKITTNGSNRIKNEIFNGKVLLM